MVDRNGKPLAPGDEVIIRAKVNTVYRNKDFHDICVETLEPCPPGTSPMIITLHGSQVEKVEK